MIAMAFSPIGLFLVRRRGSHPVSLAVLATGVAGAVWWVTLMLPQRVDSAVWVQQWAWWAPFAFAAPIVFLFPSVGSRLSRWLARCCAAFGLTSLGLLAAGTRPLSGATLENPDLAPEGARLILALALACGGLCTLLAVVGAVGLVLRFQRTTGLERSQLACLIPAGVLLPIGLVGFGFHALAVVPGIVAVPVGIGVAIMGFQLEDLDLEVNRRRLVGVSQAVGMAVQCIVAALLVEVLPGRLSAGLAGVIVALVVLVLEAVRRWVVRRLMVVLFGHREQPLRALEQLGTDLQQAATSTTALTSAAESIARSLRLPYARVVVEGHDATPLASGEFGRNILPTVVHELMGSALPGDDATRRLGFVEVSTRTRGEVLSRREERLIKELVRHVAAVADVLVLNRDLQSARERLVLAREEERLRLRNDLHDGLGPLLAGTRMQLHMARRAEDPGPFLADALTDLASAGSAIRELIHSLRPTVLDCGLLDALRASGSAVLAGKHLTIRCDDDLSDLPAAAEVAAYRIAAEAMTNVAKHADGATACDIVVTRGAALHLTIRDDGRGSITGEDSTGVGLASMIARAEELGGRVTINLTADGSEVEADIPLHVGD